MSAPVGGATAFVGALTDADLADVLPFEATEPPVQLTVEQYASLTVEARRQGLDATLARYGLASRADHERLTQHWNQRLAADSALATRFRQAAEAYEAWLSQQ